MDKDLVVYADVGLQTMSVWAKAQQMSSDALQQIHSIYGDHFPIEIRHFLASWLEEKLW